jgi:asparagine synthase (glutamine-hydrolysing)
VTSQPDALRENPHRDFESVALELRRRIFTAVRETLGDSIMLSGGLDTGIVAVVVSSLLRVTERKGFRAYTVNLNGAPSPDLEYSKIVSNRFGIPHEVHGVDLPELEESLPDVIGVLKSFDPMEIRNSVAVYIGMKRAKLDGCSNVMTGDGSDELFAGYSFVFRQTEEKARETLSHLWEVMHFSSIPLASSLGMEARLPFLHPEVKELAMSGIDFSFLTGTREGSEEVFGKFILRKAFEDMLPAEIAWRTKTPIEYGSGTTVLPEWASQAVKDDEFLAKQKGYLEQDGVRLRDKEQLKYYEIYRNILGPPGPKDRSLRMCPVCTSNVPASSTFCTICGEYPI